MKFSDSHWNELEDFLSGLGYRGSVLGVPQFRADCERFLALLLEKNTQLNLTAVRDPEVAFWKHLADSLALLAWEPLGKVVDWGSGGGLPGIPLALARRHSGSEDPVIFVDSVGKKMRAIEEFGTGLELSRSSYLVGRGEDLIRAGALSGVETIMMRAVAPPEKALKWLSPKIPHWVYLLGPSQRALWDEALPQVRGRGFEISKEQAFTLPKALGDRLLMRISIRST
ncbi:MAG TPA: RsmG family class I SAM-dependent methyltransferase [Bdellovibrionota bacterium]|jgi:16S rRNA (guanine527-N7)-methyltransferase